MCGLVPLSVLNADLLIANESDMDLLIRQMLNIGEAMYYAGAEISRIEETLYRLGKGVWCRAHECLCDYIQYSYNNGISGNGSGYSKSKNQAGCNGLVQIEPSLSPLL